MPFLRTVKVAELPPGSIRELQVEGRAVAVANVGGKIYAINNTCLHRGGPLGQGLLEGKVVTCPWHGWQFDVTNGKVVQNPAAAVDCYPTKCGVRTSLWIWDSGGVWEEKSGFSTAGREVEHPSASLRAGRVHREYRSPAEDRHNF